MFAMEVLGDTLQILKERNISWTIWCYKDAQMLGLCYAQKDSEWMRLVTEIRKSWNHYQEMDQGKELVADIMQLPGFGDADEEMNYAMQFRIRAILFEYQERYILEPLLKRYTKEELRKLPESWKFAACGYYKKYAEFLKTVS